MGPVHIIGGGLAGVEAAWQLAHRGHEVVIYEMRPERSSEAHLTPDLAELVCSNTFGSMAPTTAPGTFKKELGVIGSLVLRCATQAYVPAGQALGVDRARFSQYVADALHAQPNITIERKEITAVPDGEAGDWIIATGPLGAAPLMEDLKSVVGHEHLAFFDAIAPIVDRTSLDQTKMFVANRWDNTQRPADAPDFHEDGDYLNVPLDRGTYDAFIEALLEADRIAPKPFEQLRPFEACMPIEELAGRGREAPRFGPLKAAGLTDPRTGRWPYAVVQLRRETRDGDAYNLVGFQTRLRYPEQKRVFAMLPGFEEAVWLRLGSVHRNSFVQAPQVLDPLLRLRARPNVRVAGQLCGSEGYTESAAMGLWASLGIVAQRAGFELALPPRTSLLGALLHYLQECPPARFQPMNVNFGLVPALEHPPRARKERRAQLAERAFSSFQQWWQEQGIAGYGDAAQDIA